VGNVFLLPTSSLIPEINELKQPTNLLGSAGVQTLVWASFDFKNTVINTMSTTTILRNGISTLLNSAIVEILAGVTDTEKAVDLLKENFTFTADEMAKTFEQSYGLLEQVMARLYLSPQIKPRDELTQHNSANLALIGKALQLTTST